jgi:hypothetical protein
LWVAVTALPAAQHDAPRTHVIVSRMLRIVTFGLGSTDHVEPFQLSMKPFGEKPPPVPVPPPPVFVPVPV